MSDSKVLPVLTVTAATLNLAQVVLFFCFGSKSVNKLFVSEAAFRIPVIGLFHLFLIARMGVAMGAFTQKWEALQAGVAGTQPLLGDDQNVSSADDDRESQLAETEQKSSGAAEYSQKFFLAILPFGMTALWALFAGIGSGLLYDFDPKVVDGASQLFMVAMGVLLYPKGVELVESVRALCKQSTASTKGHHALGASMAAFGVVMLCTGVASIDFTVLKGDVKWRAGLMATGLMVFVDATLFPLLPILRETSCYQRLSKAA